MLRTAMLTLTLAAAMLNWCSTCCCGESMFIEIARGSCIAHDEDDGHHGHGHAGSKHPGGQQHPCHKSPGSAFVPGTSFAGMSGHLSQLIAMPAMDLVVPVDGSRFQAEFTRRRAPGIPPPDIPLLIQSLLI